MIEAVTVEIIRQLLVPALAAFAVAEKRPCIEYDDFRMAGETGVYDASEGLRAALELDPTNGAICPQFRLGHPKYAGLASIAAALEPVVTALVWSST